MSSNSKPVSSFTLQNIKSEPQFQGQPQSISVTTTIPDLISYIKSVYRATEFDSVQQILMSREEKLQNSLNEASKELQKWKHGYNLIEKKNGLLAKEILEMETKLNRYKREHDELNEGVIRLKEEQKGFVEREKIYVEREKRGEERFAKLVEEYEKVENERKEKIIEMTNENERFRSEKTRAEGQAEAWKQRFEELEVRVLKLEDDTKGLNSTNSNKRKRIEKEGRVEGVVRDKMAVEEEGCGDEKTINELWVQNVGLNQSDETVVNMDEKIISLPRARSACDSRIIAHNGLQEADPHSMNTCKRSRSFEKIIAPSLASNGKSGGAAVIEIDDSDSDDDMPISLRFPSKVSVSNAGVEEITNMASYVDNMTANLPKKAWACEGDMLTEFERDPELCLNAVCALYRQHTTMMKLAKGSLLAKDHGFKPCDALRGKTLARFLTDDNPAGKVKKTVSELQKYDPVVIDACEVLAKQYSHNLFEMYKKEQDPFFRH